MAFGGPAIVVKFLADTSKLAAGVDQVESQGSKLKRFAGGALFAGMTAGAVAFGKASVDAATESAVATKRLEQIFASMGDTTGDAAKQAEAYASSLSKKIGVDDEAILAAQAQLATFAAVSDETARGAGVFDRATAAAADLAAAGFGTLDSNAIQLGKALQDPTKGLAALGRSGVTFTDAQKAQIAAMQKSGDLLGAQKVVLKAVESQVKGTAAATATSQEKAAVAFGETQEVLGQKLLPVVKLGADAFARYSSILIPLGAVLVGLMVATKAYTVATNAAGIATKLVAAAQWLWNTALAANPIILIVAGVVALVAAIILAYQKVDWFRALVDTVWQAMQKAFRAIVDAAKTAFDWIRRNWPLLLAIIVGPIGLAVLAVIRHWDTIKSAAKAAVDWIVGVWRGLASFLSGLAGTIGGIIGRIVAILRLPMEAASAVVAFVRQKFDELVGFLSNLAGRVFGAIGSFVNAIKGPVNAIIRGINALRFTIPRIEVGVGPAKIGAGPWTIDLVPFDIPQLARGGLTTSAGLAYLHPAEVITPLSQMPAGGNAYYITVEVPPTSSPYDVGRSVVDAIRSYERVAGPAWRTQAPGGVTSSYVSTRPA